MPIIQIPFEDPVAPPPPKPEAEQLDLYAPEDWEDAYRDLDSRVPHLLVQLQDDLTRSRRREAAWISIITHLLLIILVANIARLEKYLPGHRIVIAPLKDEAKRVTYLELPPDLQKLRQKSQSNIVSDKDRVAMTRHPELDPKQLQKALPSPPPGAPRPRGQQAQQPAPQTPPAMAQNQPPLDNQQGFPQPPAVNPSARLPVPAKPNNNPFSTGGMSAGSAIQEAARAAAARRGGGGGQEGDFGLGTGAHGRQVGALDILSDTQGVDFSSYIQRVVHDVRENWYRLIPESAEMKKGKLAIEFAITKDGQVAGMKLIATSGDTALDRAAWGGITGSNPFPPLPSEFGGQYLALRFRFYYNPDKSELE
jgi:TonB family protein